MKKLFLFLTFSWLLIGLFAEPISQTEALSVANSWLQQVASSNTVAVLQPLHNSENSNLTDMYLATFTNSGFLLLSADDTAQPVLAYDLTSTFPTTDIPDNLAWFIRQYSKEIGFIRNQYAEIHPDWRKVRQNDFSDFIPLRPVSPLLQTTWDQSWPYNSMCPADNMGSGGHALAGCGATAMGQIMKFWAYPTHGIGSHSYNHPDYGLLSADFANTTYNYASMPNSLWFSANTNISTLLYHCGIAQNMDYGPNGSGSQVTAIRPAFVNFFGYESTAQTVYKYAYTTANWEAALRAELDAGRPIFYFGHDTQGGGGHAWVCDGYSGTNYFHMNWGWSGSFNGYFYTSNLNPAGYAFNNDQGAVIGLRPPMPITPPTNLTATVDAGNNVFLQWQGLAARGLLGYTVYRNGTSIAAITDPLTTQYYDINLEAGTYSYYLTANFTQGESAPSNSVTVTIYPAPVINYQESFENFTDFATDLSPWFTYDLDQAPTAVFADTDFPHEGEPLSYIVFNPSSTVPAITEIAPYTGNKLLVCLPVAGTATANNDWFCSPKWNTGSIAKFRFWARSAFADSGLAKIKVGLSTSEPEPQNMTVISGSEPIAVPTIWTGYEYNLTANTYSNVFVGIQCLSDNGSVLLLDRFQLWSSYVENDAQTAPDASFCLSVYPNPARANVSLTWQQKEAVNINLSVYDVKGRLVRELFKGKAEKGSNQLIWNGTDNQGKPVANGLYFCRLIGTNGSTAVQKIVYLRD